MRTACDRALRQCCPANKLTSAKALFWRALARAQLPDAADDALQDLNNAISMTERLLSDTVRRAEHIARSGEGNGQAPTREAAGSSASTVSPTHAIAQAATLAQLPQVLDRTDEAEATDLLGALYKARSAAVLRVRSIDPSARDSLARQDHDAAPGVRHVGAQR